jgi:predicted secreted Zn-dependent protease
MSMSVQALCDRLVANDASLTELVISLKDVDDAEFKLVLDAAKKNKTIKKVSVRGLGVVERIFLASLQHCRWLV